MFRLDLGVYDDAGARNGFCLVVAEEIDELAEAFKDLAWELYGVRIRITSTFRSRRKQLALYRQREHSVLPAAAPGRSTHEYGLAFDAVSVDRDAQEWLGRLGESVGLIWGGRFRRPDPVHFQVVHPDVWQAWLTEQTILRA